MAWEISLELRVQSAEFSMEGELLTTEGDSIAEFGLQIAEFSTDEGASACEFFSVWRYGSPIVDCGLLAFVGATLSGLVSPLSVNPG